MISTSEASPQTHELENRRVRLERLLQIASRDYDLRFEFGSRDLVGESQIVMKASPLEATLAGIPNLKGYALNLLGHKLSEGWTWYEAALRQEVQGRLGFAALWHALEDARVENWFIRRWSGAAKYFDANILPNLGGVMLQRLSAKDQLAHGIYLEGRGFHEGQYAKKVRQALEQAAGEIRRAAHGASAQDSYSAMLLIYPLIAHLLKPDAHKKPSYAKDETLEESAAQDRNEKDGEPPKDAPPDFEEDEGQYAASPLGQRQEFPEWFRPGSAPWFEKDLGGKEIHPSALRTPQETVVDPPQGDSEVYKRIRVEVQREAGYLAHRLTNLIREEVYLRYAGYYRSGRLNKAKLWKQRIGNYRLFQRLVTGMSHEVAFALLVDESASMKGGEKYMLAMKTAILLGETLEFVGVPLEIIGYTTQDYEARAAMKLGLVPASDYRTMRCSPLEHRIYKRFDEPFHFARTRLTGSEPRHN
ncbi:MAG: cobaltochelatase CobT-related protein, partial [Anaerolineales bacterium]